MNLLIIMPYSEIYPPQNGGMKRCFHVINQLSKHNKVTVIGFQEESKFILARAHYVNLNNVNYICPDKEVTIPFLLRILPQKIRKSVLYRIYKRAFFETADGNFLRYYDSLILLLKTIKFDAIILENLSCLNAVSVIKRYDKKTRIIYDAHNFDTHLAENDYSKGLISKDYYESIKLSESGLYKLANLIWSCSELDKTLFERANLQQIQCNVIPNGVEVGVLNNTSISDKNIQTLLFCGTIDYFPNEEGLTWFIDNCWLKLKNIFPTIKLIVIGSGKPDSKFLKKIEDNGVSFLGRVENVIEYYEQASLCIVPLLSGSGTRLKVLEAMSLGVPIVSTGKGAEGISYTTNKDILIANDEDEFVEKIQMLLEDVKVRLEIASNARTLIEAKYDWNHIGGLMTKSLNELVNE